MSKLIILFVVTVGFLLSENCSSGSLKDTENNEMVKTHEFEEYVVFEKSYKNKNTEDFVVLKRSGPKQFCKLDIKKSIFVLKDQENGFFSNLFQNCLFIDYGTGPDSRTLSAYDIINGKKIFETPYSDTIAKAGNDSVSIWIESSDTVFSKYEEHQKWKENGLGTVIVVEHFFDLKKLQLYKTSNWKCEPLQ
jgi:hypothetical protein